MLEMYRQNRFHQELLEERCTRLLDLDRRLHEIDSLLAALRQALPPGRCECGAPLVWGSHFCANCGRPVSATPPVVSCTKCGAPQAADAKFCAVCGHAVAGELVEALPAQAQERWEQ